MKNPIEGLNKLFESRIRLGVMSILMVNEWVDFISLREYLEITDGNLASHLKALETNGFIEIKKQFVGRKPKTSYRKTPAGKQAFSEHLGALEHLIKKKS
ncbi:MAG: transcriptional regulator [Bacteroidales bacterium]|nr:transcriptional regulator [Bacteroidales bacterium]